MLPMLFCQVGERVQPLDLDRRAMSIHGVPHCPSLGPPGGSRCLLIKLRDDKPFAALSSH